MTWVLTAILGAGLVLWILAIGSIAEPDPKWPWEERRRLAVRCVAGAVALFVIGAALSGPMFLVASFGVTGGLVANVGLIHFCASLGRPPLMSKATHMAGAKDARRTAVGYGAPGAAMIAIAAVIWAFLRAK